MFLLKDCYFQIGKFDGEYSIIINPKKYWNKEQCLDDSGESPDDLPINIGCSMEGVYESDGIDIKQAYKELVNLGAEFKIMFPEDALDESNFK